MFSGHCSGLLDRTSLRHGARRHHYHRAGKLFRPSRPDFIETDRCRSGGGVPSRNCSGLLDRTSLRRRAGGTQLPQG